MNREILNDYSKAQLIAMARAAGLPTGDTARNSKEHYIELLLANAGKTTQPAAQPAAQPVTDQQVVVEINRAVDAQRATGTDDTAGQLAALLAKLAGASLDPAAVRAIVAGELAGFTARLEAVENSGPRRIEISMQGAPSVTMDEHTHPLFEKVVRLCKAGLNVALVGPAGCGKSHLARQVATALQARTYAELNCTSGASEADLTGYLLPTGAGGAFEYHAAPFVDVYENGGVFMLDEFDAADPNMALVINAATANGHINLPKRLGKHSAKRGDNVVILAGLNTTMTGADATYSARNAMDGSTADRWYMVRMGYDEAYEAALWGAKATVKRWQPADPETCEQEIVLLCDWIKQLRQRVQQAKLRRIVSTRAFQKAIAARRAGVPMDEIKSDLRAGWTTDELAKVGG